MERSRPQEEAWGVSSSPWSQQSGKERGLTDGPLEVTGGEIAGESARMPPSQATSRPSESLGEAPRWKEAASEECDNMTMSLKYDRCLRSRQHISPSAPWPESSKTHTCLLPFSN